MSITRNRELSQFGSFIYIDNDNQSIGIATEVTPSVGIGTASPSVKFEVVGDTNIRGTLEASGFTVNGNPLVSAAIAQWNFGSNPNDIYRLQGNVGIGTSVFTQKLTVLGNISAGQFISTVTSGTAPFTVLSDTQVTNLNASFLRGKVPPNGFIVGTTDTQTLTNKTLSAPAINGGTFSSSGVTISGATSGTTTLSASAVASGVLTLPAATTTLVGRTTTDILTNKTIAASSNTITGLTNANLSGSAGITNANLANSTISGVALGGNLEALLFSNYLTTNGTYNGSTERTVSVFASTTNTANAIVARDSSGDFSAGDINCSNLTASFTVTAQEVNSTSDNTLKTNIKTVENSLDIINTLRGVSFDWKETGKSSYGVIAQELEKILPQLVNSGEIKSVNYNGLIGILIEAVKELSKQVEELKNN